MEDFIEKGLSSGLLKVCPGCGVLVEKVDGCNYLKCLLCNVEWCWFCEKIKYKFCNEISHNSH